MTNNDNMDDAVATEIERQELLRRLGLRSGDHGEMVAENCLVTFYSVGSEYEVDILLPNGSAVGFDAPEGDQHD
jgi:hypothetical protein